MPGPYTARADYGVDAPGVIRNLALAAAAGLGCWITAAMGVWSGVLAIPVGGARLLFPLSSMGPGVALGCGGMAAYMFWSSKVGKVRERAHLLDLVAWTGGEQVLDIGCGRGLLLIGAAKRLTTGKATGIDLWQAEDLSGNRAENTLANATAEGVASRIEVLTADMRSLPFPAASFDVVVSKAAIHNLYNAADRVKAIAEIARVLKPGGHALIDDIRHLNDYAAAFAANGCRQVEWIGSPAVRAFFFVLTMGSLRPGIIKVTRDV